MNDELLTALQELLPPDAVNFDALRQAALSAYEAARADGLCHEGALEIALQVMHAPTSVGERPAPANRG